MEDSPMTDRKHRVRWDRRGPWDHKPNTQLAMGIFIVTLGVLLTLDRLNIINTSSALRLWPAGLIALGATILLQRQDSHGRFWGFGWMFLGSWLLLNTLGILRIGFWDLFWPLLLMFIGVRLITRSRSIVPTSGPPGTDTGTSNVGPGASNLFAVMGESKRTVENEPFRGAHMTAVMGGCTLDLRLAVIAPGEEAVVDVFAFMGGLEIAVPSGWRVVSDVAPVLGGVDDKRLPSLPVDPTAGTTAPRLVIRGMVMLGGLTIKS
jgi:hypothetical protein